MANVSAVHERLRVTPVLRPGFEPAQSSFAELTKPTRLGGCRESLLSSRHIALGGLSHVDQPIAGLLEELSDAVVTQW